MPCIHIGGAIVCTRPRVQTRRIFRCPTCEMDTVHVEYFMGVWYGFDHACSLCGDRWADGELYPRPFKRAWRVESAAKVRRDLDSVMTREQFDRRVSYELSRYDL